MQGGRMVRIVVAALRLPYDLAAFPEAPTFVCAYSAVTSSQPSDLSPFCKHSVV